jgi:hypothetical protein
MKIHYILFLGVLALVGCVPQGPKENPIQEHLPVAEVSDQESETKTDAEVIKEGIQEGIELGKDLIKQFKTNDSIREAERERIYGYRIGFPIKDVDEVFEIYKQFENTEHIYVLKQSHKEYYLFYSNGGTEKQLSDSLQSFRAQLPEGLREHVIVMNMTKLCTNSKEKIMMGANLSKRKEDFEIPCLICDK